MSGRTDEQPESDEQPVQRWRKGAWLVPIPAVLLAATALYVLLSGRCGAPP